MRDYSALFKMMAESKLNKAEFKNIAKAFYITTDVQNQRIDFFEEMNPFLDFDFSDNIFPPEALENYEIFEPEIPFESVEAYLEAVHAQYGLPSAGIMSNEYHLLPALKSQIKDYPLHFAVSTGDMQSLPLLLRQGHLVNQKDDLHATPLHIACVVGNVDAAHFLLAHGANINAYSYYAITPLEVAIMQGQLGVTKLLISTGRALQKMDHDEVQYAKYLALSMAWDLIHEPNLDLQSYLNALGIVVEVSLGGDSSLIEIALDSSSENIIGIPVSYLLGVVAAQAPTRVLHDVTVQAIESINSNDTACEKFLAAKALFHVMPVDGTYTILYDSKQGEYHPLMIEAEGHFENFTTPLAFGAINNYVEEHADAFSSGEQASAFNALADIFEQGVISSQNYGNFVVAETLYQQYLAGETILLPSGWKGHFVNVIINPNLEYFVVANCGDRFREIPSGANVYEIHNLENITPELIHHILNNQDSFNLEYACRYMLGLKHVEILGQPNQTTGNCAWQSHEPAVEAILYMNYLEQGFNNNVAKQMAKKDYEDWDAYQTLMRLKEYFEHDPRIGIEAIFDMMHDNHKTLFKGTGAINPHELEQATYLASVLASEQYAEDFSKHFSLEYYNAKPELVEIFKEAGLNVHSAYLAASQNVKIEELIDLKISENPLKIEDILQDTNIKSLSIESIFSTHNESTRPLVDKGGFIGFQLETNEILESFQTTLVDC